MLTGGPGTGKTTTTLGIISAYKQAGCQIILAAPTGRAAKRMSEATGMEAKTIHRLLEYKPPEGYQKNEEHPLEGDVLILDEVLGLIDAGVISSEELEAVLKAKMDETEVIMTGRVLEESIRSYADEIYKITAEK